MRHAIRRQRLAWAAVGLAMAAAAAGCSQVAPTQAGGPTATTASFRTQQLWLDDALIASGALAIPGGTALTAPLGLAQWGRPFAAGFGYPLILPHSSLWVGSGIQLLTGTWPFRSVLYAGV